MKTALFLLAAVILLGGRTFAQGRALAKLDDTTMCRPYGKAKPPCIKTPPKAKETSGANFTKEERKQHAQEIISLTVVVGADGHVLDAVVKRGITKHMDDEAIQTVMTWFFEPARMSDGTAIPVEVVINLNIASHS
jgi:outer membrane biosynthesis protein TonB